MKSKQDFSWEDGKIKNGDTLGRIVSIPTQEDLEPETFDDRKLKQIKQNFDEDSDIVVDEFKEKMTEILSRELHRRR
ncbi:hypothetical protein SAMN04488589_0585 [Methanolobus vulcani]|jgi:hypothetical protein|uniref:Uncharacterized protein n=1 Tax=Methanolobus vulcani TaxID=38026 RepID=A0A7Z7FDH5_9EURY|nr:hypothetical protein [Methanolobus vulcani]SDF45882.1 hypothetical protein SAMN04488589_0585 [Methanolobus vulcani]